MKLMYLAERAHFIRYGVPITGDRLVAMPLGPVPSSVLDALNGEIWGQEDKVFTYLSVSNVHVELLASPGDDLLTETNRSVLDEVIRQHGGTPTWTLVEQTHQLPEYRESYVEGTSRPIPYERIAKFSGNEDRFRHGRPVISQEMAAEMTCPFSDDSDL